MCGGLGDYNQEESARNAGAQRWKRAAEQRAKQEKLQDWLCGPSVVGGAGREGEQCERVREACVR